MNRLNALQEVQVRLQSAGRFIASCLIATAMLLTFPTGRMVVLMDVAGGAPFIVAWFLLCVAFPRLISERPIAWSLIPLAVSALAASAIWGVKGLLICFALALPSATIFVLISKLRPLGSPAR